MTDSVKTPAINLNSALRLAELDWNVLPLHTPDGYGGCSCGNPNCGKNTGKHPRIADWSNRASTDPAQIRQWFEQWPEANVGILTGELSNLLVLDVDPRNGGEESLAQLQQQYAPLPDTVKAHSGGGGEHIYFAYPEDSPQLKCELMPGIDIQGNGHCVVAPPSVHQSKKKYAWQQGCEPWSIGLAPLPEWLLRLACKDRKAAPTNNKLPALNTQNASVAALSSLPQISVELLRRALDSVNEGAGRNDTGFSLACQLRDAGVEYSVAEKVMANYVCQVPFKNHPYESADALASLAQAYKYAPRSPLINIRLSQQSYPPPSDSKLRDCWIDSYPHTNYCQGVWRRYNEEEGIWQPVDADQVKKEIAEIIEQSQCERLKLTSNKLNSVCELARIEVGISPGKFDANPNIIVVGNGVIDLATPELWAIEHKEHSPDDYATSKVAYDYDPQAKAPTWAKCLERLPAPVAEFLQEFAGYALTADMSHEIALWLNGPSGSGKSTILEGLMIMLGQRCGVLGLAQIERSQFALSNIEGKTLVIATEQPSAYLKSGHILNALISGEGIIVEQKYQNPRTIFPKCKVAWAMNQLPRGDVHSGLDRRIKVVQFGSTIMEPDTKMKEKLQAEGSGILNWALQGLERLRKRGKFVIPEEVRNATSEWIKSNDVPALFVEECCEKNSEEKVQSSVLYEAYKEWCHNNGFQACNIKNIAEQWKRLGLTSTLTHGLVFWKGVKLKRQPPPTSWK